MALVKINDWQTTFDKDHREWQECHLAAEPELVCNDSRTIFEKLASPEADFTQDAEGQKILEIIRGL